MNKVFIIVFICFTACNSPANNTNLIEKIDSVSVMSLDTTNRPEALQVQQSKLLNNLDGIASVAEVGKRKMPPDSVLARMQWDYLSKITDSAKLKVFDLEDKFYSGYFLVAYNKTTQTPKEYLLSSISQTNRQWTSQVAFVNQGSQRELIPVAVNLATDIYDIEREAYMLFKVQKVEVTVKVLDSNEVEQAGFSVYCDSKFSKERDNFNPTKNAKKEIYPGTKVFYIQKGNVQRTQEALISATDPNTRLVIIKL